MSWFYEKQVKFCTFDDSGIDAYGANINQYTVIADNVDCDIQPYSSEKLEKDYGYRYEVTHRLFCDIYPQIQEENLILYNGDYYKIKKILQWDDFAEMFIIRWNVPPIEVIV